MENALPTRSTIHWDDNRRSGLDAIRAALYNNGAKKGRAATASCSLIALCGATLSAAIAVTPSHTELPDQVAPQPIRSISPATPTRESAVSRGGYRAPLLSQEVLDDLPSEADAIQTAAQTVAEAEAITPETTFAAAEDLTAIDEATALVNELLRRAETATVPAAAPISVAPVEPDSPAISDDDARHVEAGATSDFDHHDASDTSADAAPASAPEATVAVGLSANLADAPEDALAPIAAADADIPVGDDAAPNHSTKARHASRDHRSRTRSATGNETRATVEVAQPDLQPAAVPPEIAAEVAKAADNAIAVGARLVADSPEFGAQAVADVSQDEALAAALTLATAHLETLVADAAFAAPVSVVPAPMAAGEMLAFQAAEAIAAAPDLAQHIGSTSGFSNGLIPDSALCDIPWDLGEKARCDAVAQLERLNEAFKAEFGYDLGITDSYRSYSQQVAVKASRGVFAAPPGFSNHGWGLALDLGTGISNYGSPQYNWMYENAPKFGWQNPDWARPGGTLFEPWHWEYTPLNAG